MKTERCQLKCHLKGAEVLTEVEVLKAVEVSHVVVFVLKGVWKVR